MIKYLYIVDYWVPFPQSEYGGTISVIAENEEEAFTLLSDPDEPFYNEGYTKQVVCDNTEQFMNVLELVRATCP